MMDQSTVETTRLTEYNYHFEDKNRQSLTVLQDPSGVLSAGIGATVWDSALVLAKALEYQSTIPNSSIWAPLKRKNILELGSGTGILGLVVAALLDNDARITLSDKSCALPLLQKNVDNFHLNYRNKKEKEFNVYALDLDWLKPDISEQFDCVLVSDCIHWPELFSPLISTLLRVCHQESRVFIAYERRNFEAEVNFFRELGQHFFFKSFSSTDFHPQWKSEDDIYVFEARLRI